MKLKPLSKKKWIWVVFLLGGLFFLALSPYNHQLLIQAVKLYEILHHPHRLKEIILSFGPYAPLAYILIQIVQVVVAPIPGGPIEFLGGYLFGIKAGLLYSMIGLTLGSWFAFSLAKIFERWAVERFVSPETLRKFDYLIGHEGGHSQLSSLFNPGLSKGRSLLHLRFDAYAFRCLSDHFDNRKNTRNTDGDPSGSKGLRSAIQNHADPLHYIDSGDHGLLYLS